MDDNGTTAHTGDDILVCTIGSLTPGSTQTCILQGSAVLGSYVNIGTAQASFSSYPVSDTDPSYVFGAQPSKNIYLPLVMR